MLLLFIADGAVADTYSGVPIRVSRLSWVPFGGGARFFQGCGGPRTFKAWLLFWVFLVRVPSESHCLL